MESVWGKWRGTEDTMRRQHMLLIGISEGGSGGGVRQCSERVD